MVPLAKMPMVFVQWCCPLRLHLHLLFIFSSHRNPVCLLDFRPWCSTVPWALNLLPCRFHTQAPEYLLPVLPCSFPRPLPPAVYWKHTGGLDLFSLCFKPVYCSHGQCQIVFLTAWHTKPFPPFSSLLFLHTYCTITAAILDGSLSS